MDVFDVEEFIANAEVDDRAANALRDAPEEVRRIVIGRGSLVGARNPSSVLLARLREAENTPKAMLDVPDAGYVRMRGLPYSAKVEDILTFFEGFDLVEESVVIGINREGRPSGEAFVQFANQELVDDAIETKNKAHMGDRYIELYTSSLSEVQRASGSSGGGSHRNESTGKECSAQDVEDFLRANPVDERAENALRELRPDLQKQVLDRGHLASARNPSSVLLGRIRDLGDTRRDDHQRASSMDYSYDSRKRSRTLEDDVEDMIRDSGVDDRAARTFRSCEPAVQEIVLRKGIAGARNPSPALLARIRDAESETYGKHADDYNAYGHSDRGHQNDPTHDAVEQFLYSNRIDAKGADAMRSLAPAAQKFVMDKGDMHNAHNASSALMARIKEANGIYPRTDRRPSSAGVPTDVEDFIRAYGVDDKAGDALRNLEPHLQQDVIARGGLANARSPSSVLLSRIRDVQPSESTQENDASAGFGGYGSQANGKGRRSVIDDVEDLIRDYNIDDRAAADLRHCTPEVQEYVITKGLQGARNPSSALLARIKEAKTKLEPDFHQRQDAGRDNNDKDTPRKSVNLDDDVEDFIVGNEIDPRAADAFRECDDHVKESIIRRADLTTARNPSSALMAMVKEEQGHIPSAKATSVANAPKRRPEDLQDDVEEFIKANAIDESAGNSLRDCGPELQTYVLDRGSVASARNPSSVLLSRIRDGRKDLPPPEVGPQGKGAGYVGLELSEAIDLFIRNNNVDDMAADALRGASPNIQEYVLDRGDLVTARNPSSALLARIREARQDQGGKGSLPPPPSLDARDVEDFLKTYDVDHRAGDQLRGLPPALQHEVLKRGGLANARNPSSVLLSRIREVQDAGHGGRGSRDPRGDGYGGHGPDDYGKGGYGGGYGQGYGGHGGYGGCPPGPGGFGPGPFFPGRPDGYGLMGAWGQGGDYGGGYNDRQGFPGGYGDRGAANGFYDHYGPPGKGGFGYAEDWRRRDMGPAFDGRGKGGGCSGLDQEVENFIRFHDIDHQAGDTLRRCEPRVQQFVLDRGIKGARNPSSALLARIRDATSPRRGGNSRPRSRGRGRSRSRSRSRRRGRSRSRSRRGAGGGGPRRTRLEEDVENFIRTNEVDRSAAESLRQCDPHVQARVIEREIRGARNTSAALLARIRDVKADLKGGGGGGKGRPGGLERHAPY